MYLCDVGSTWTGTGTLSFTDSNGQQVTVSFNIGMSLTGGVTPITTAGVSGSGTIAITNASDSDGDTGGTGGGTFVTQTAYPEQLQLNGHLTITL